jgi:gas vesicle protein
MSKKRFALGLALGAIGGAVVGILSAPRSGKETKARLKNKAGKLEKKAKNLEKRTRNAVEGAKKGFGKTP